MTTPLSSFAGLARPERTSRSNPARRVRRKLTAASKLVLARDQCSDAMLDHLADHSPHLQGLGFGGVGVGIALSAVLVLALPCSGWRTAWWTATVSAAVLSAFAWSMGVNHESANVSAAAGSTEPRRRFDRRFAVLFISYSLEGVGYIIAGTFLVAAIKETSSGWLGNGAWLFVGVAAAPPAALWAWLGRRWSHPTLLVAALVLRAVGIALPAVAGGSAAAFVGAALFDLQIAFQRLELLRKRWARDGQPVGRATEVQLFGDREEIAQLTQLHAASVIQCEARPITREQTGRRRRASFRRGSC